MILGRNEFENELRTRALPFTVDLETDRYRVTTPNGEVLVSVENLLKDFAADGDLDRIPRFVDAVLASNQPFVSQVSSERLFWCLEPNDYIEKADIRIAVSDCVDRVLTLLSPDNSLLTWVSPEMLATAGLSDEEAANAAFANLARELVASKIEYTEIDGVRLGYIAASIPIKSSLMLAPNLRSVAEGILGWPLLAVAPDRDFLYLWAARHKDFVGRVGRVIVEEYTKSSYPISTEVYSINDEGIEAIGAFPKPRS